MGYGRVINIEWPDTNKLIDVGDVILSNKKIKKYFGWSPKTNLVDGLKLSREYYNKRLKFYLR
jgi:nucleoside-diphosphate-sugar epimerase